jgi:hypothetical protein
MKKEATMYDGGKIVGGLVVFVALVSFPTWYTLAGGDAGAPPKLAAPQGKQCVESKEFMAASHMQLLDEWRDLAVRDGVREYTSREYGTKHEISLSNTCLGCHGSRDAFCTKCHTYAGVDPYCWSCHVDPKAKSGGK